MVLGGSRSFRQVERPGAKASLALFLAVAGNQRRGSEGKAHCPPRFGISLCHQLENSVPIRREKPAGTRLGEKRI